MSVVSGLRRVPFGRIGGPDGAVVEKVLFGSDELQACFLTYGATLFSLTHLGEEVTLHHQDAKVIDDVVALDPPFYGSTVGRVGNRICGGKFVLGGKEYKLATNNGPNTLHGGLRGFDKVLWQAAPIEKGDMKSRPDGVGVKFTYRSPEGEEGFPGNLQVAVSYVIAGAELWMEYEAEADADTPISLTNHTYWNLSGNMSSDVLGHVLRLHCPHYLPVDGTQIPTGEIKPVDGTLFDFRRPHEIGARAMSVDGGGQPGYDHCYVVGPGGDATLPKDVPEELGGRLRIVADALDPARGRRMMVWTTQPGCQLYTANWLSKSEAKTAHRQHMAFCLETQNLVDCINQPTFVGHADPFLKAGDTYKHTTVHSFGMEQEEGESKR